MKLKERWTSINWFEKLVEILVVVIGITLAFVVDRSYESYKNQLALRQYLSSLHEDIQTDIRMADSLLQDLNAQNKKLNQFVHYLTRPQHESDSILFYIQSISRLTVFEMRQTTFKSMQSSGQINLIPNFQLRRELFNYYHQSQGIQVFQKVMTDYFNRHIVPILLNKVDLQNEKILDPKYFNRPVFRNIVLSFSGLLNQQVRLYGTVLRKAQNLQTKITQNG